MFDFVILHGSFGNPYENWFPWLYKELSARGKNVLVPDLPINEGQNFQTWNKVMSAYADYIGPNTIFIAHSISPAFVVDYVISNEVEIGGLIAVAPFYGLINIEEFDEVNNTFFFKEPKWDRFVELCKLRHSFYSDNDPYVPIELTKEFIRFTESTETVLVGGKHINTSAGYSKIGEVIEFLESHHD